MKATQPEAAVGAITGQPRNAVALGRVARIRRKATRLAAVAVVGYAICVGILYTQQRAILFPTAGMTKVGLPLLRDWEEIHVRTADGQTLRALWHPPRAGCGLVLAFHGNGSYPETAMGRFSSSQWTRDGWGTLAIAYRGYPGSTGSPSGVGLTLDARAAYAEAKRRAPDSPILAQSHSIGGWPALNVASEPMNDGVKGLYMEAPFASAVGVATGDYPWVPVSLLMKDPMRSDLLIATVKVPTVIVHGRDDGVIPLAQGKLLASLGHDVTLDVIPGDHVDVYGREDAKWEPWFTARMAPKCSVAENAN